MSGLVYVLAKAPWGPVRVEHAASMGDLLRIGVQPAHIERCDDADPAKVVRLVLQSLDPAGAGGWIAARADKATKAIKEAHRAVAGKVVAVAPVEASPRPALAAGGMTANDSFHARMCEKPADSPMSANERFHAPAGAREAEPANANVRSIRQGLRMTQAQFAQAFGFPVATVAGWEQGRNRPDGPAQILLRVIRHRPDAVREALATP